MATRTFTSKVQRVHHASSTCPQSPAAADEDFFKNINTVKKLKKKQFKLILVWFNKVLQCLNFLKNCKAFTLLHQLHTYFTSLKNSGDLSSHGHGSCCTAAAPCRRFSIGFSVIIKSQIFSTLLFSEPSLVIIFIIDLNDSSTFRSGVFKKLTSVFVYLCHSVGAPVHQLPNHDRDGGTSGTGKDLHFKKTHQVLELDRSHNQRYLKMAARTLL